MSTAGTTVLAVVAAAALAGCGDARDEERDALRREDLSAVLADALPGVAAGSLDCATDRLITLDPAMVDDALAAPPDPNGDEAGTAPIEARLAVRTALVACLSAEELVGLR